jgi:hypothetical protein
MRLLFFLFLFATSAAIGQKIKIIGKLPKSIEESSGLTLYNDTLFITHNDSGDKPILYFINLKGDLIHQITISNAINNDWEEITKDEQGNIYIGDFGNNLNKRKNLTIYKITLENLLKTTHVIAKIITFSYPDQKAFPPEEATLNFDAEAMFFYNDSLWVFTKCRAIPFHGNTFIYAIPIQPGNYTATAKGKLFIGDNGFAKDAITGVTFGHSTLYLLTYNRIVVYELNNNTFQFKKTIATTPYSQKEAIAISRDQSTLFLTDEVQKIIGGGNLYKINLK